MNSVWSAGAVMKVWITVWSEMKMESQLTCVGGVVAEQSLMKYWIWSITIFQSGTMTHLEEERFHTHAHIHTHMNMLVHDCIIQSNLDLHYFHQLVKVGEYWP